MKKLFLLLVVAASAAYAEMKVAENLDPIEEALAKCDKQTLVLLDLGDTVINAKDPALHSAHNEWKSAWFKREYPNMTRAERLRLNKAIRSDMSVWMLLDSKWPALIKAAKAKGAKVFALTKQQVDPSLEGLTKAATLHFGLEFDEIIETDAPLKGPVLEEYLQTASLPGKIIFVDDKKEQITSVHDACVKKGIPCTAIQITAFTKEPPLNKEIGEIQLRTLATEHRWIPQEVLEKRTQP
jgi:hypothetical protein